MTHTFTAADIGCYLDSARGVYIGEAVQASALLHGWDPEEGMVPCDHEECERGQRGQPHSEADHGMFYDEATTEAEDHLNGLTSDDVSFGSTEGGDWGLWLLNEEENE